MDKEINEENSKPFLNGLFSRGNFLFLLLFLIFLNILYLDYLIFNGFSLKSIGNTVNGQSLKSTPNENCSPDCVDIKISNAISKLNKADKVTPSVSPTPTLAVQTSSNTQSLIKDNYVAFGSGLSTSNDWQDVAGVQAYVDSSAYGSIKTAVFEAALHIPTGNETVSVRLYNSTDSHPVWNSQIDFKGNTVSQLLASQPVTLDSGNKLYKVQMLTQLSYQAILDQSRLHITTK